MRDDPIMPGRLRLSGGIVFLRAVTTRHGLELWRTDGTREGTVLVADIWPGPRDSEPQRLFDYDGTLLFVADDGEHGRELWRSDGTAPGTRMVVDLVPGQEGSDPNGLTRVGPLVYFTTRDQIWKTDGTAEGTRLVTKLPEAYRYFGHLVDVDGTLFYTTTDLREPDPRAALWGSDGTEDGTRVLLEVIPRFAQDRVPCCLARAGRSLVFAGNDGDGDQELWTSDGTSEGTVLLEEINADGPAVPWHLTTLGDYVFFSADDGVHGRELWVTDGTASGTIMAVDLEPGPDGATARDFHLFDETVFFATEAVVDYDQVVEVWLTRGTAATTRHLGTFSGLIGSPGIFARLGDIVFFPADDGVHRRELWRTDGTRAGTVMVKNIVVPSDTLLIDYSSSPGNFVVYDGVLLFTASLPDLSTWTLWKTDGTEEGTVPVLTGLP